MIKIICDDCDKTIGELGRNDFESGEFIWMIMDSMSCCIVEDYIQCQECWNKAYEESKRMEGESI